MEITIDEFLKVELKTAKVISAERVEGSNKLIKLRISVGEEERTLMAGIGKSYSPESLIGKTIIIVSNLKPRVIKGVESQGMLLAVEDEGNIVLLTTDKEVKDGLRVG